MNQQSAAINQVLLRLGVRNVVCNVHIAMEAASVRRQHFSAHPASSMVPDAALLCLPASRTEACTACAPPTWVQHDRCYVLVCQLPR
jgi:hypothetical protein